MFYTDGVVPWNSLDDNTRGPLSSEFEGGYPCGEADQMLFNWTAGWPIGNIWNMILQGGITPDADKLLDLARAVQSGKVVYAAGGGTGNAVTASFSPAPANYPQFIVVRPSGTNTGAVSITINDLPAVSVLRRGGVALVPGDMAANTPAGLVWNGTAYELLNPFVPVPGTGFSGRRSNQGWTPIGPATSTLNATFTAPSTGVVIVFSTVNKSYSSGSNPNILNVALINGVEGAADSVNVSTTSITSSPVQAGSSVTVASTVTIDSAPAVSLSQYLNYIFIPA